MLKIKNITITYDDKLIVNNFNLNINKGEILCIVGESGSGKTSLLKSIIKLLPLNASIKSGDIFYENTSILNMPNKEINKLRGEKISFVFQDSGLSLNPIRKIGRQFIQYIKEHKNISTKEAHKLATSTLEKMNLKDSEDIMNSYIFNLSGGMKQRVGLAMALSLNPSLLLLDEPTSALDVTTQAQVVDEILKLKSQFNTSILMVTHDIPLAIYMADRIIVMKDGEIIEENSSFEIFNNPQHEYTKVLLENIPRLGENNYGN